MHNLRDLLSPPDAGDVITAEFLQQLTDFATRQQIPPNSLVDGTGVYQRLPPAPLPATELVPFRNDDSAAVPANGVICCYRTAYPAHCPDFGDAANANYPAWGTEFPGVCAARLNYYQSCLLGWSGGYFVNAGPAVASHSAGLCSPAVHKPVMGLYQDDTGGAVTSPLPGEIWGPAPGAFTLYRGLPGFMVVGPVDTTNKLAGVMAVPWASCWCAAKEAWHYGASFLPRYDRQCWVTCYPLTGPNGGQYDGSSRSPHIELILNLRRGALDKDPNVVAGNMLVYRATSAQYGALPGGGGGSGPYFEPADCCYLDDPVGAIKPFATALPTGIQGWGVMNGSANSNALGGSGIDGTTNQRILRPGTPGNTGGATSHVHGLTATGPWIVGYASGTGLPNGTDTQSNLPPYAEIGGWLERLNNGQQ